MKQPLTAAQQEVLETVVREALAVTREHLKAARARQDAARCARQAQYDSWETRSATRTS